MHFLDNIDNCILITPLKLKVKILDYINSLNKLVNIKITSFEELKKIALFDYDERAILYLIEKYNYNIDVAKELLKNIYYVDDISYKSKKLNNLVDLKKELIENNLLDIDRLFIECNSNKPVIVFGYDYINKFNRKILNTFSNVKIITKDFLKENNEVYKFTNLEKEILFIIDNIIKLVNNNVPLNKINILNVDDEYKENIIKYFKMFNIPVNVENATSLESTIIGKDILRYLEDTKDFESTINYLNENYIFDSDYKDNVYNAIISIFNKYSYLDFDISTKLICIRDDFKNKIIKSNKTGVNISELKDNYFSSDEYVFLPNFSEGVIPLIHKDEDYLSDNLKEEIGLESTKELNILEKESLINSINSINNLFISYKEEYKGDKYYLANIAKGFKILEYDFDSSISYSDTYSKIKLGSLIDDLIKYGDKDDELDLLYNNISIPYREYNNDYKLIDNFLIKDKLNNNLSLSYTTLNTYYLCSYRYYIDNILKINKFTSSFDTIIGELFHYILSKSYEDGFDLEKEFQDYLKDKELSSMERFYIDKLKKDLELVVKYLKDFNMNTGLTKTYREKWIEVPHDNYTFKGIIDKIMYKDYDGKTLVSIIDYKTGSASFDVYNSYYGLDMQLPIYLYLLSESHLFTDYEVVGLYLERILNSEVNIVKGKTYEEIKYDNLKLNGISTDNLLSLERFDPTYQDSNYIKSMKYGSNGFYKYTKVMSSEDFDSLCKLTKNKIEEAVKNIYSGKFDINPKKFDTDKDVKGCSFCKYKDICFRRNENIQELTKLNDLSFLKDGDKSA